MIALLTLIEKDLLVSQKYDGVQYFNPTNDFYGNWFISKEEIDNTIEVNFQWVKSLVLSGKNDFLAIDLHQIIFDEANQVLTLYRFNGTSKSINYVDLPNQADFSNLKNYIIANYGAYISVFYQRKDNLFFINDGNEIKKLVINAMPVDGHNLFNIVGMICINLVNQ